MSPAPARATRVAALALLVLASISCARRAALSPPGPGVRPNIVLIVVDTLRADHLPFYGYARATMPQVADRLAARGVVVERAVSAAPWTMPSMAALLTGLDPRRLSPDGRRVERIPADAKTLAERLAAAGYETAGFSANPLLAAYNGYARGFATFWRAPGGMEAIQQHAPALQEKVASWLEARPATERRPLFLWAHYIDPHDPYDNEEMSGGRSRFDPDYRGALRGNDVQKLYSGEVRATDPAEARRALGAYYDAEIHYVDRFVAGLVEIAERRLGPETLFVFTADHGEELGERGGWKHGQTLYDEQLRVPLVFRWDGRIAPGSRKRHGTASLLDVAPTLLAAARVPLDGLDGHDLLPAILAAEAALPPRWVVTRHWNFGALRVAAQSRESKVMLFNPREHSTLQGELQEHLEIIDHARLPRFARFDMHADPAEQRPLGGPWIPRERALAERALADVESSLAGLRIVARDLPEGAAVEGRLRLASPPGEPLPFFLADADEVAVAGSEVRFRLGADVIAKGFVLPAAEVEELDARLVEAAPDTTLALRFGQGARHASGRIALAALARADWPTGDGTPTLWLWTRDPVRAGRTGASAADESERELRALGYVN